METAATINTTRVKDIYSYSCLVHICVALVAELDVFLNQPAETPLTVAIVRSNISGSSEPPYRYVRYRTVTAALIFPE